VAEALGKLGHRRAIEPLLRALKQSYAQAWSYESSTIAQALGTLGEYAGGPLLAELRDSKTEMESDDPEIRREAIRKLSDSSDERVAGILKATLKDPDQSVRWEATKALGRVWRQSSLVELGDSNAQTRRAAALILGRRKDAQAVEPLVAALQDRDHGVREMAADALGAISIGTLASLLHHKDREIRQIAGRALAKSDSEKVVEVLAFAIQDHRWWVREIAADTLVKRGDQALPALEKALRSDDPEVCKLARVALRRIGTFQARNVLRFGRRE
jgi:HEAT repeat protein